MTIAYREDGSVSHLVSCRVRLSYPQLFEPKPNDMGTLKYSALLICPKPETIANDTAYAQECAAFVADFKKAAELTVLQKFGTVDKVPPVMVTSLKALLKDGDGAKPKTGERYDESCHGSVLFSANANGDYPPSLVLNEKVTVDGRADWRRAEPKDLYPGCYVRVGLSFYLWGPNKGGQGVSVNLLSVQKLADGDQLGGASRDASAYFGVPASTGAADAGSVSPDSLFA